MHRTPTSIASKVAKDLNITPTTLYMYVNGDGSLKEVGQNIMNDNTAVKTQT